MATTTTSTVETTFVVNASGQAAGGIWPHFKLLVDGREAGQATVNSTSTGSYTFKTQVAPGAAHNVQIVYDNDWLSTDKAGMYRDLTIKSLQVNGKTVAPTSSLVTYDKGAIDGQDVVAGQEAMWWDGALKFALTKDYFPVSGTSTPAPTPTPTPTPVPATGTDTITVSAKGNGGAHFNLLVDGKKVGEGTTTTTTKDFTFKTNATDLQAHKVQVQYDNDGVVNGVDRNLTVSKIAINGKSVLPTDGIVTYDKGALDGRDVVKGQADLWWNGSLVVNADKSFFPAGGTGSTPAPTPVPTPPKPIADGYLSTEGSQIVDSSGQNVKLTGVNWFGAEGYAFAPQGLWMDSYQNHMDKMKELGFNTIRLPFSDAMLDKGRMPTGIDYSKNPDLRGKTSLEVFDKIIEYADKTGMKIMLDHHRSGDGASANENGLWYTDEYPESVMIENWKMLAQRYADNPSVIAADLNNEPHGQATWGDGNKATDWAAAAERIGNAIQSVNPNWLLVVEGVEIYNNNYYWWGGNLQGVKDRPIDFDIDNKLVYSVHDYGPSLYMMDWFKDPNFPNNMPAKWDQMWGNLVKNDKAPVLVGEFGSKMETDIDKKWMPELIQYMNGDWNTDGKVDIASNEEGVSWTYWAWSPGSGDTGGIMKDDWTVDYTKLNAIKPGMFDGEIA